MDLLEYKGKQVLERYDVPLPAGEPARTVDEAVAAAAGIGYPRRRQGAGEDRRPRQGRRDQASPRTPTAVREHADAILGMDIRGHTVRELWIEQATDIASEYYAADRLRPLGEVDARDALHAGRHGHRAGRRRAARGAGDAARRSARRLSALPRPPPGVRGRRRRRRRAPGRRHARHALRGVRRRGRHARRDQPAHHHARPPRHRARREGHARRQRRLPPSRPRRARRRRATPIRRSRWPRSAG